MNKLPIGYIWYFGYYRDQNAVVYNEGLVEYDKPGEWYSIITNTKGTFFCERGLLRELTPQEKILYAKV